GPRGVARIFGEETLGRALGHGGECSRRRGPVKARPRDVRAIGGVRRSFEARFRYLRLCGGMSRIGAEGFERALPKPVEPLPHDAEPRWIDLIDALGAFGAVGGEPRLLEDA